MSWTLSHTLFLASLVLTPHLAAAEKERGYVTPGAPFEMERSHTSHERTIGRLNGWNINIAPGTSLLGLKANGKQYMVVSYGEASELAKRLENDARTLLMQESPDLLGRGLALLEVNAPSDVEEYAQLAEEGPAAACGKFQLLSLDSSVTSELYLQSPIHDPSRKLDAVAQAVANTKTDQYSAHQNALVSLGTRCHTAALAAAAPDKVQQLFQTAGANIPGFKVAQVTNTSTSQKSVVATIPGTLDQNSTVVIGGHLDSIVGGGCTTNAPGADDDATGIAAITEVIRTVNALGLKFERTIELHGYAGEEAGLLGSGDLARSYKSAGRQIISQMQWDMLGYGNDDTMTLITSNTSATMNRYVKDMAYNYVNGNAQNVLEAALPGGASSDHASWTQQGFPAVFPFERLPPNSNIHSTNDTIASTTNTALAYRMIKLGIAYLSHMAGLVDPSIASSGTSTDASTDLKIAILPAKETGEFYLGVAGAAKFQAVELCRVPAGSQYCENDIRVLPYVGAKAERHFYMDDVRPAKMTAGESWRAHAYDATNQLVARRDFTIGVK